ncbi:MAG: hypothetical protein IPM02_26770 [Betaproteobacteria bacterium]|nr:hypothetical protein [Betaproteobacteria bacterium]
MISYRLHKGSRSLLLVFLFATTAQAAQTGDISTVPLETYSAPSSTDVKPNVLFVLDDSGSMDWDFMPDWACVDNISIQNSDCSSTGQDPLSTRRSYNFRNPGLQRHLLQSGNQLQAADCGQRRRGRQHDNLSSQTGQTTATGAGSGTKPNWTAVRPTRTVSRARRSRI